MKRAGYLLVFLVAFLSLMASVRAAESPKPLTVIAITDFHGALEPEVVKTVGGESVNIGGAALLATYVNIIRSKAPGASVVIDAGDLFQGTLESNLVEGASVIRFYNHLEIAAAALGNHEFDFGPEGEKSIPASKKDDPRGALKKRVREANFPFLAANVRDAKGRTPHWLRRSIVVRKNGLRIGIVGAATPMTPSTTVQANLVGLTFEEPAFYVAREARRLREKRKVDVVILTFHGGGSCRSNEISQQDDLSTCQEGEELFSLLKKLPEGLIDVAVGGHTHQGIAKRFGRTAVLQAYSRGQQVAWAEVPITRVRDDQSKPRVVGFEPVCGNVVKSSAGLTCIKPIVKASTERVQPARFLGVEVKPDAATLELIEPDLAKVRSIKERPLGVSALTPLARAYSDESALGNLTVDVMRESIGGAVIAVTNGGGLRANIAQGPINYGHVFEVLPFDNRMAKIKASGALVRDMVTLGHNGRGGNLSWSGLSFSAKGCEITSIEVGGKPLDLNATYLIASSDYLATGGGGFDRLAINPKDVEILWNGPYIMRDVVAQTLSDWKRDLRSADFFDPKMPRQRLDGVCAKQQ